jgi:hypothetical protein
MFTPNITHATTTSTSSGNGSSAYSNPWFHPIGKLAPQFHAAQPRHDVIDQAHVSRQQPSEQHPVDVQRAQPAVAEHRDRAEQLRPDELRRDDQRDDPDDEEVRDRADEKPLRGRVLVDRFVVPRGLRHGNFSGVFDRCFALHTISFLD